MSEFGSIKSASHWIDPKQLLPPAGVAIEVIMRGEAEPALAYYDRDGFRLVGRPLARSPLSVARWRYAHPTSQLVGDSND